MARKASPWYRAARNEWCVTIDGEHHRLGEHPKDAPPPKKSRTTKLWNTPKEIETAYRKLLGRSTVPVPPADERPLVAVLDSFLAWCYENRAAITADRYREFIQDFIRHFGKGSVLELSSDDVSSWLDGRPTWNSTTKANAITAVSRALNWAVKNRGLSRNPIKGMEKPTPKRKSEVITPEEFETLLGSVSDERFRDLLIVSYDCGARPQETKKLEARHIDLALQRAVLPTDESKGKRKPRIIYFPTERSVAIVQKLMTKYPEGPIFRNRLGNPWTGNAVKCRFEDLDQAVGRRITQYQFRRTWITRKLIAGVDSHVVAQLSGHASTEMIDKHYSAVAKDHEFMLKQAARDISPATDT